MHAAWDADPGGSRILGPRDGSRGSRASVVLSTRIDMSDLAPHNHRVQREAEADPITAGLCITAVTGPKFMLVYMCNAAHSTVDMHLYRHEAVLAGCAALRSGTVRQS